MCERVHGILNRRPPCGIGPGQQPGEASSDGSDKGGQSGRTGVQPFARGDRRQRGDTEAVADDATQRADREVLEQELQRDLTATGSQGTPNPDLATERTAELVIPTVPTSMTTTASATTARSGSR